MKMFMWFWYDTLITFSHLFCFVNLVSFTLHEMLSKCIDSGYLWVQLILQFCTNCFETLQMFSAWKEDMHVFRYNPWIFFFSLSFQFSVTNLSFSSDSAIAGL